MKRSIFILLFLLFAGCKKSSYITKLYFTMGTTLEITLPANYITYADSIYSIFERLDSLFHPLDSTSDVNRINAYSGKWVQVAMETAECIRKSNELSKLTNGEFDITIGKIVDLWRFEEEGHFRRPKEDTIKKYQRFVDYRVIKVDGDSVFIGKGQKITLSGIAKGYALDLVKRYLISKRINSAIINAGGDMLIMGKKGRNLWRIGIQSPWKKEVFTILEVKDKFVATSGNYVRYLKRGDTVFSHIFNPKTGEPLRYKRLSVTIISDTGYVADGLATALSVMEREQSFRIANSLGVGFIGIYDNDTIINELAKEYIATK